MITRRAPHVQPIAPMRAHRQAHLVKQSADCLDKPKVVYRLPRQKIKRVPVTSCDSCRLRKLKCDAKVLPRGATCGQCAKNDTACTFEDRDEVLQVPKARCKRPARFTNVAMTMQVGPTRQESAPADLFDIYSQRLAAMSTKTQAEIVDQYHGWELPTTLSNTETGKSYSIGADHMVKLLVDRFFAEPNFSVVVMCDKADFMDRLKRRSSRALPSFLLQVVVACAAASHQSVETELQGWKASIWASATESVHAQLSSPSGVELELMQALLLLSGNWAGDLARAERIHAFDAAMHLATTVQLHQSVFLSMDGHVRAKRIALFWTMYCYDKILCSVTGRPAAISRTAHDMPYPTMDTFVALGIHQHDVETAWIQRLTIAYISLCELLEDIHVHLTRQSDASSPWHLLTNADLDPLEHRLEDFCKENRWFLHNLNTLPYACRHMAEAVISQMHLTQLQLYLISLKREVDLYDNDQAVTFSLNNQKALAATLESAWHLVQQAPEVMNLHGSALTLSDRPMSLSLSCALFGASYFRFLAGRWAQWDGGKGCEMYAPWASLDNQVLQAFELSSSSTRQPQSDVECEQSVQNANFSLTQEALDRLLPGTTSNPHDHDSQAEEVREFILPVPSRSKTRAGGGVSASSDSFVLCTPARLFFQDDARIQDLLRDSIERPLSASHQAQRYVAVEGEKSHAMLAPISTQALDAFCNMASEEDLLRGVMPPFSGSHLDTTGQSANYVSGRWVDADGDWKSPTLDVEDTRRTVPRSLATPVSATASTGDGCDAAMSLSRLIDQYSPFKTYNFAQRV